MINSSGELKNDAYEATVTVDEYPWHQPPIEIKSKALCIPAKIHLITFKETNGIFFCLGYASMTLKISKTYLKFSRSFALFLF